MNVYIPLALLVALICYFFRANEEKAKQALWITMAIACAVLAVRYEFGPDYFNYRAIFEGIHSSDVEGYTGRGQSAEKAFLYFISIFPSYTAFILFLTIILFICNTYFISRYISPKYYSVAILFMFLEPTFLLLELVAMRAALGAVLFVIAFDQLLRGKRLIYIGVIFLASLFHTSIILLAPLVLLNTNNKSILLNRWLPIVCLVLAVIIVSSGVNFLVLGLVDFAMDSVEELNRYEGYLDSIGNVGQSIFTLLFRGMSFVILYYLAIAGRNEKDPQYIIIYKLAVLASIIQLILGQSLLGDRYLMYFNIVYITAIARSLSSPQVFDKRIILLLIAAISLYILYNKMGRDYNESLLVFHTIFNAPVIP